MSALRWLCNAYGPRTLRLDGWEILKLPDPDEEDAGFEFDHGPGSLMHAIIRLEIWRAMMEFASCVYFWADPADRSTRMFHYLPLGGPRFLDSYLSYEEDGGKRVEFTDDHWVENNNHWAHIDAPVPLRKINRHPLGPGWAHVRPYAINLLEPLIEEFRWITSMPAPYDYTSLTLKTGRLIWEPELEIRPREIIVSFTHQRPPLIFPRRN